MLDDHSCIFFVKQLELDILRVHLICLCKEEKKPKNQFKSSIFSLSRSSAYWQMIFSSGKPAIFLICKLKKIARPHGPFSSLMQSYGASLALFVISKLAPCANKNNEIRAFPFRQEMCLTKTIKFLNQKYFFFFIKEKDENSQWCVAINILCIYSTRTMFKYQCYRFDVIG